IQARVWLGWGCSQVTDLIQRTKLDCPFALGTDAFPPQRPESFRHILLLSSPSAFHHRRKPTNLRIRLGAGAAQLQASGLRVRSHAGACSSPAKRTTERGCLTQARFCLERGRAPGRRTAIVHAGRCAEVLEARGIAAFDW